MGKINFCDTEISEIKQMRNICWSSNLAQKIFSIFFLQKFGGMEISDVSLRPLTKGSEGKKIKKDH